MDAGNVSRGMWWSLTLVALLAAGCAGPKGSVGGPVYYVTGDVVKVAYGESDAQIACETVADVGSNVKEGRCYTRAEVIERHERNRQEVERFGDSRCPAPSLCKR